MPQFNTYNATYYIKSGRRPITNRLSSERCSVLSSHRLSSWKRDPCDLVCTEPPRRSLSSGDKVRYLESPQIPITLWNQVFRRNWGGINFKMVLLLLADPSFPFLLHRSLAKGMLPEVPRAP
jgi:hypothetical protein